MPADTKTDTSRRRPDTDRAEAIELRSEKARALIGPIPRPLVVGGIVVTIIVAAALAVALILLPYPYGGGESILRHLLL